MDISSYFCASYLADLATIGGVLIGGGTALVALSSYRQAKFDAASSHMHGLFREYLTLRMQYEDDDNTVQLRRLTSFKLYVLDEVQEWIWQQQNKGANPRLDEDEVKAWQETVDTHLRFQPKLTLVDLTKFGDCYGTRFRERSKPIVDAELKRLATPIQTAVTAPPPSSL